MAYGIKQIGIEHESAINESLRRDLERGLPLEEVEHIVNDETRIEKLQRRLANTADFMGLFEDGGSDLLGFSQSHEWRTGDQMPYVKGRIARRALQVYGHLNGHRLLDPPYGIFNLGVSDNLTQREQRDVASGLLADVLTRGFEHHDRVRVGLSEDEPLLPVFKEHGFRPIGEDGAPLEERLQLHDAEREREF